jgi:hypothetical protein
VLIYGFGCPYFVIIVAGVVIIALIVISAVRLSIFLKKSVFHLLYLAEYCLLLGVHILFMVFCSWTVIITF